VAEKKMKSTVQGVEYFFAIDVKGGEYRERGGFVERETCKKKLT
jgi:hypothetical protein